MNSSKQQDHSRAKQRFWHTHISAWEKSGLSQNEYCRRHALRTNQFCYWKKKLFAGSQETVNFVPVVIGPGSNPEPSTSVDSGLTVCLGKISIKLSNDFNPSALIKAVEALGEQQ